MKYALEIFVALLIVTSISGTAFAETIQRTSAPELRTLSLINEHFQFRVTLE